MGNQTVLIQCKDEKGLIHTITGVLLAAGLNIVVQDEFVDNGSGRFFMRTEVSGEGADLEGIRSSLARLLPRNAVVSVPDGRPKELLVFAGKESHCLGDLLVENAFGALPARIMAVMSNHDLLKGFVEKFSIPFHHVPSEGLSRAEHEEKIIEVMSSYRPDYLVLAKYMRILSADFVERFQGRIVNIHHSFLPAFIGASPYHRAHERGVKIIGATAHFVTHELDEGPIIAQDVIPVDHRKSAEDMIRAGRNVEKMVLNRALRLVCEDRVFVFGRRTIIFE